MWTVEHVDGEVQIYLRCGGLRKRTRAQHHKEPNTKKSVHVVAAARGGAGAALCGCAEEPVGGRGGSAAEIILGFLA